MKILRSLLALVMMAFCVVSFSQQQDRKSNIATVVLSSDIKCNNCKNRIEKNIPYEKGVKDLKVDLESKTITIVYRKDKNNAAALCSAVEKLGYKSEIKEEK